MFRQQREALATKADLPPRAPAIPQIPYFAMVIGIPTFSI